MNSCTFCTFVNDHRWIQSITLCPNYCIENLRIFVALIIGRASPLYVEQKNCSFFPTIWSLPLSMISMFLWFSANKGLYLRTNSFALVNISYHCSYVPKIRTSVKKKCYIVRILYLIVNEKHVELTAVLGFRVILVGSFFAEPCRCNEAKGFVFCILLCNTDDVPPCTMCAVV